MNASNIFRNVNAEYLGGASSSNRSFCKTIARWQEALVTLESPGFSRGEDVKYADKIDCITAKQQRCPNAGLIACEDFCRTLTQREQEIGQTLPVGYTKCLSYNQACDVIGNAWTVDVIVHILNGLE